SPVVSGPVKNSTAAPSCPRTACPAPLESTQPIRRIAPRPGASAQTQSLNVPAEVVNGSLNQGEGCGRRVAGFVVGAEVEIRGIILRIPQVDSHRDALMNGAKH